MADRWEEIREKLWAEANPSGSWYSWDERMKLMCETACKRIAELEAERRWVEFSERLPEDSSSILIRYLHGEVVVGFWDGDDWHDHDGVAPSHVTHWMPLPKPPEVSDGE